MSTPPIDKYVSVDWFRVNRNWSSRVIHNMHPWQRPYKGVVTPSKMTFGTIKVGDQSATQTGTFRNVGYRPLKIESITAVGEFLVTHDAPLVVEPGATFSLSVIFNPQSVGLKSGGVYINTGDAAGTEFIEFLGYGGNDGGGGSGPGTKPTITITDGIIEDYEVEGEVVPSPTSLSFGSITAGETSEPLTLTLTNEGTSAVTLDALVLPEGFTRTGGTLDTGSVLGGGASGTLILSFSAETAGTFDGVMSISLSNDTVVTVNLTGSVEGNTVLLTRLKTVGNQFVNQETDENVVLRSANWFGAESTNYTPHGTWKRNWKSIVTQIKSLGFNCIRLPFSGSMVGATPPTTAIDFDLNPEFKGLTSLEILDLILDYCLEQGIYVVLDHHRREAGAGADGSPISDTYTKAQWIATWTTMANRYKDHLAVIGADVHNEPHDLAWADWAALVEECGEAIQAIAPEWIIFVEGVGSYNNVSYWWGGALGGVRDRPVALTTPNKLAYSPHEYGQSVGGQSWLAYEGQTAPTNWPNNLYETWDLHWSFIHYENIAPIWIGEMGGKFGLDGLGNLTQAHRVEETAWMSTLITHLNGKRTSAATPTASRMSFAYWSYNPNSADTGGLLQDDWETVQQPKMDLLAPLFT